MPPPRRLRASVRTWQWALCCVLATLAAVAVVRGLRYVSLPGWLGLALAAVPLTIGFVAAVMCLFTFARDVVVPVDAQGRTEAQRGRGDNLLWDALQIGSSGWSIAIVIVSAAAGNLAHIDGLPRTGRLLIALAPLVPVAMYLRSAMRNTEKVDELALHIRREAYGFAFWALTGIIVSVQLLQTAEMVPVFNWGPLPLIAIMLVLLVVGAAVARRRYR